MKTRCHRGGLIVDQTDDLPHKGHMIPDQEWFAIWDAIDDEVIAPVADRRLSKEVAYHLARQIFFRATRLLYQCHTCGRLYLNDKHGNLHCYLPANEQANQEIVRSRE